jgi:hypothetical protein
MRLEPHGQVVFSFCLVSAHGIRLFEEFQRMPAFQRFGRYLRGWIRKSQDVARAQQPGQRKADTKDCGLDPHFQSTFLKAVE